MYFCIRDDDTSFFTSPEELERVYGAVSRWGPISFAVVPFHRAGTSKAVPDQFRGRWSVHPLHENQALVGYLRTGIAAGRFEIMLHGYHHDEPDGRLEFASGAHLAQRITDGRKYLEDLLGTTIRLFVTEKYDRQTGTARACPGRPCTWGQRGSGTAGLLCRVRHGRSGYGCIAGVRVGD